MKNVYKIILGVFLLGGIFFAGIYTYAFSGAFLLQPGSEMQADNFSLESPFVVNFPKPIDAKYYKNNINLTPKVPMAIVLDSSLTKLTITPKTAWQVNTSYQINIPQGRAMNFMPIESKILNFKTIDYPKVVGVVPEKDATDVRLDIEDPIVVNFDKSTEDFFIDFRLTPNVEIKYTNNEDKTQFSLLPSIALADETIYTLKIFAKAKNAPDLEYSQIYETNFKTLASAPKTWAQNLTERVEQAKIFTQAKIRMGKYIDVNLSTQIMTTFENGKLLDAYLVSSGKKGLDTPKGTHQIYNKSPRAWSKAYGLYMPYWMAIAPSGKFGIHELPEWPGGYKEGQNHLGIPVSHGCVRLGVGPAETVYNWAEIGTPVVVY